ncbi:MAG: D-sedoheptulose 7-phosphate isomerase [Flavobacteriales bacterium]|nr:D-sedoheptulose 7-phosphate isomerase [Flavobacteriales bacterium]
MEKLATAAQYIVDEFNEHKLLTEKCLNVLQSEILQAADICLEAAKKRNTIFFFGNGGSAADAEHLAAEFTGRYQMERKGLPAIALTAGSASITSISNDFGFDNVFSRQLEALAKKNDVCIGISTSGKSPNVTKALEKAKIMGCKTIALTGKEGGDISEICDVSIIVPSDITSRIQEMHILIGHIICYLVESRLK